jgi:hypothetical protein
MSWTIPKLTGVGLHKPLALHAVGRSGWITKLNVYSNGKCITGIKVSLRTLE